jgi:hypothetical protein
MSSDYAPAAHQQSLHSRGTTTSEPIVVAQESGSVLKNSNTNQRAIASSAHQ